MTEQIRPLKEIFGDLYGKLMSFTLESEFLQELGESLEVFYNLREGDEYEFNPSAEFMFLTWFLLDDTTPEGYGLIDEFLKRNADDLSLTETQICKALKDTNLSIYQVKSSVPGVSLELRDVFTGEHVNTVEASINKTIPDDTLLFTRVLKLGDVYFLVGAGVFLDKAITESITQYITEQYREYCEEGHHQSFKDFLKENGEMINWWIRAFERGELNSEDSEDDDSDTPDNSDGPEPIDNPDDSKKPEGSDKK